MGSQPFQKSSQEHIMKIILIFAVGSLSIVSAYPYAQAPGPGGLAYPKAGPNGPVLFSQYTNVAASDVYEWGYRRGNDPQWVRDGETGDAYEGQGEQFYDYNHGGYAPKAPEYAPLVKVPSYTA